MQFENSLLDVGRIPMAAGMLAYTLCVKAAEDVTGYDATSVAHVVQESKVLANCVENVACIIDACRMSSSLSERDRQDLQDFFAEFIDEYVRLVG